MSRVVVFDEFGTPDVMRVVEEPAPTPEGGEIRVRIEAFAVNPLDLMMRSGNSPAPVPLPHARLGIEGTGIVDALGPGVSGPRPGTPVILTAVPDSAVRGSYADYVTVPAGRVIARPGGLSIAESAAIWVGFSTAYGALVETAEMRSGDSVVITAATGAVGRAAIQIARQVGAIPIAVTRAQAREPELIGVGATAVVATDRDDLAKTVRAHTGGVGADIVLDLVGGPGQQGLVDAARPGAKLITAGFLDPRPAAGAIFPGYRSFLHTLDPTVVGRMADALCDGLRGGAFRPRIDSVLSLDQVVDAHRRIESGANRGKIVVTM